MLLQRSQRKYQQFTPCRLENERNNTLPHEAQQQKQKLHPAQERVKKNKNGEKRGGGRRGGYLPTFLIRLKKLKCFFHICVPILLKNDRAPFLFNPMLGLIRMRRRRRIDTITPLLLISIPYITPTATPKPAFWGKIQSQDLFPGEQGLVGPLFSGSIFIPIVGLLFGLLLTPKIVPEIAPKSVKQK